MDIQKAIDQFTPTIEQLDALRAEASKLRTDIYALENKQSTEKKRAAVNNKSFSFEESDKSNHTLSEIEQSLDVLNARLNDVEAEARQLHDSAKDISETLTENACMVQKQFQEQFEDVLGKHKEFMTFVNALHETHKLLNRRLNAAKFIGEKVNHSPSTNIVTEPFWNVLQKIQVKVDTW